jgi:hypothetical protein
MAALPAQIQYLVILFQARGSNAIARLDVLSQKFSDAEMKEVTALAEETSSTELQLLTVKSQISKQCLLRTLTTNYQKD